MRSQVIQLFLAFQCPAGLYMEIQRSLLTKEGNMLLACKFHSIECFKDFRVEIDNLFVCLVLVFQDSFSVSLAALAL